MPLNRVLSQVKSIQTGVVILGGRFVVDSSGDVDYDNPLTTTPSCVIAKVATGKYNLTLDGGPAPGPVIWVPENYTNIDSPDLMFAFHDVDRTTDPTKTVVRIVTIDGLTGATRDPVEGEGFVYVLYYVNSSV